jgi:hypothetical protein
LLIFIGGFDGYDVNWECKSNLPTGVRLSHVIVGCEGYDQPDDPYILHGSCQAIFSLEGAVAGSWNYGSNTQHSNYPYTSPSQSANGSSSSMWTVVFLLGFLYVLYQIFQYFQAQQAPSFQQPSQPQYQQQPSAGGYSSGNQWFNPSGGSFWSNLGWAGLIGSMFARR